MEEGASEQSRPSKKRFAKPECLSWARRTPEGVRGETQGWDGDLDRRQRFTRRAVGVGFEPTRELPP